MRTTIELSPANCARLTVLAAQRGEQGPANIVAAPIGVGMLK